ncbi:hypothetical protein HALLA_05995 [Halostagnicola larsenii XH-48]|uniref:Uncharacterized protein n=1 Tax=Halostagnicola larsenii XH-48 TaxID=797299 RepID=W0JPV4_9EURY|nr:hypothetical protein HALLA_05995 [Halostagnicola larsenii XH-48]
MVERVNMYMELMKNLVKRFWKLKHLLRLKLYRLPMRK